MSLQFQVTESCKEPKASITQWCSVVQYCSCWKQNTRYRFCHQHRNAAVSWVINTTVWTLLANDGGQLATTCFGLYGDHHQVALTRETEYNMQISHKIDVEISDSLQYVKTIHKHGSDSISFGRQESLGHGCWVYGSYRMRLTGASLCGGCASKPLGVSVIQGKGVHV
jgi:hypothetical protein